MLHPYYSAVAKGLPPERQHTNAAVNLKPIKAMNTDKENKQDLTNKGKNEKKDITNSLEHGVTDSKMPKDKTPQGRTDNEQDAEKKKHNR